jgi:hypothetical protein
MTDVTAKSAQKTNNRRKPRKSSDEHTALQLCYRQIGISAVAAAARYQSGAKNPVYAPPRLSWTSAARRSPDRHRFRPIRYGRQKGGPQVPPFHFMARFEHGAKRLNLRVW